MKLLRWALGALVANWLRKRIGGRPRRPPRFGR